MFISIRRAMRERKEALQTPRSEPRHASAALPANTVQLGILGLVATLSVLRAPPMDSPDAPTWWTARPRCVLDTTGAAGAKEGTLCCSFVR